MSRIDTLADYRYDKLLGCQGSAAGVLAKRHVKFNEEGIGDDDG